LIALPVLKRVPPRIDPRRYNGASLLGLRGIVVKSHGGADALAFANAIRMAILEVEQAVPERISEQLAPLMAARQAL
jgi:phosphate acyltransferase